MKLYSYLLLLVNMVLLAHSFIPHTHNHDTTTYLIHQNIGKEVVDCGCKSCSIFVKIVENTLSQNSDADSCNCCKHNKTNCFISVGYYTHQQDELNSIHYFIAPTAITINVAEDYTEYSYAEAIPSFPNVSLVTGLVTRAPPVLFS